MRVFENHKLHSFVLFKAILQFYDMQAYNVKPKYMDSESGKALLLSLNINPISHAIIKVKWVSWLYPPEGRLKLNIEGASKGNLGLSRGGVIIRNHWGQFVLAGSYSYDKCTNMEAEIRSLLDGLSLIHNYGLEVYPWVIEI